MKCPRCGEMWFDPSEEYSLETCHRCELDDKHAAEELPPPERPRCSVCGRSRATVEGVEQPTCGDAGCQSVVAQRLFGR